MPSKTNSIEDMDDDNTAAPEEPASTGEAASEPEEPQEPSAEDELDKLRRDRDELHDRLLRRTAEFDNYRKRVDKERRELREWAAADVLTDLLAVLDDFERALAIEAPAEAESYVAGVELIHRQLEDLIRKRGLTPIETIGADFDPHQHQAVAYEETPGARDGEIVGEMRKGYRLGDRLLRPALVRVAKAS